MVLSTRFLLLLFLAGCIAVPLDKLKKDRCLKCKKEENPHKLVRRSPDLVETSEHVNDERLPREVSPNSYKLQLIPDIENESFKGHVWINFTCLLATDTIVLNAYGYTNISHSEVKIRKFITESDLHTRNRENISKIDHPMNTHHSPESSSMLSVLSAKTQRAGSRYTITVTEKLLKNHIYQLEMVYTGIMSTAEREGVFKLFYNNQRMFAATKMRPTYAREVFPCFDEPQYKVPFEVSIGKPDGYYVISNMPQTEETEIPGLPGWKWQHFQKSPPLSTFSFGFLMSDFDNMTITHNDVVITFHARAEFLKQLEEAKNITPKIIEFIETYLKVKFPLKKIDLVALPSYAGSDPIDHYGLILFRESDLVGETKLWYLTQELAYQWIGHYTSPHWWNHALINMALVNYVVNAFTMQWKNQYVWTQGYSLYYGYGERHPFANLATQIENIKASKGTWLLRMLNYTLTEETFRNGLQSFLDDRQFNTFSDIDLWAALDTQGHEEGTLDKSVSVSDIAKSWREKERFPLVTATRNYEERTVEITQHTFLRDRPHDFTGKDQLLWYIPIMYITPDNINVSSIRPTAWMKNEKKITMSHMPHPDKFIIINPEEIGMFMVNYDASNWALLSEYLTNSAQGKAPMLSTAVRAKLLHDAWNLAYAGELNFISALDMTLFLPYEKELKVWDVVFTMIDHLGRQIEGTEAGKKFMEYSCELLTGLLKSLGKEGRGTELGRLAVQMLSQISRELYIQESKDIYKQWMNNTDPEAGNPVADTHLCTVFKWGCMEEWEFGLQRVIKFPARRLKSERLYLLKTLAGCPRQEEKIERLLNVTLLEDNKQFPDNDLRLIFSMLTGSSVGSTVLFKTLLHNWDMLKARFESKPHMWEYLVGCATESFKSPEGLDMVTELYVSRQNEFGTAEGIIEQALKKVKEEAKWSEDNLPVMEGWLKDRQTQLEKKKTDQGTFTAG